MKNVFGCVLFCNLLIIAACNNPAADKPKATTSTAAPATPATEAAPLTKMESEKKVEFSLNPTNTTVGFVGSKITGNHEGKFEKVTGTVTAKGSDPATASVQVSIDMVSVKTDSEKLDGHLKSPDFFDVEKFPNAEFKSTKIAAGQGSEYTVHGNLTLHGVARQISFPATIVVTDGKVSLAAEFSINRKDFGIIYPGMPDDLIRDDVLIRLKMDSTL